MQKNGSSTFAVTGWILGSILCSVGIILVNKVVMKSFGFSYVFTLTALHFLVTALGMEVMALMGIFQRAKMPFNDLGVMAVFCISSVAFMNFSLNWNSVGLYQVFKLLCIPCMVVIQTNFYGQTFSSKIKLTLVIIIAGVGLATITDVQLNTLGSIAGAIAVLSTSQFQIMQGDKQRQHKLSPMQINHVQAAPSFMLCACVALLFEFRGPVENNVLLHVYQPGELLWIGFSCVLAIAVNLCSYGLIGKTSPVTYQVVGHAKTILVMVGGFIMFPIQQSVNQLVTNVLGIVIAMIGVIVYGHLKMLDGQNPRPVDWCDMICPRGCFEPATYEQVPTEEVEVVQSASNKV